VQFIVYVFGDSFDLSFTTINGIPTENKTEAFLNDGGNLYFDAEEAYVYAYEVKNNTWVAWNVEYEKAIGAIGYGSYVND